MNIPDVKINYTDLHDGVKEQNSYVVIASHVATRAKMRTAATPEEAALSIDAPCLCEKCKLNFHISEDSTVTVFDLLGNVVYSTEPK